MFAENFLENTFFPVFIRRFLQPFTVRELVSEFKSIGIKFSTEEMESILDSDPNIISLENKKYVTHAGAFTGKLFSFIPTEKEIEQGVLVLGDRGIPFVDSQMLYFETHFSFNNKFLKEKVFKCDCNIVRELFFLHDDEITDQIVAKDPANADLHIAERDFELPHDFYMTGCDVKDLFKKIDFKYGDRIIAYVSNWDYGTIEILPLKCIDTSAVPGLDFLREKWYEVLEECLLASFKRDGACSGISAQLANVFFDNKDVLCNISCGSISEFLQKSKKVSMECFGVESRLWRTDEEVPAKLDGYFGELVDLFYFVSDYVMDSFLKDSYFDSKKVIPLKEDLIQKILPESMDLAGEERDFLQAQIENREKLLQKTYNWFADFKFSALRRKTVEFYVELRNLFFEIDCRENELAKFPQPELIALTQFFSQTTDILENIEANCEITDSDDGLEDWLNVMNLAVDGMSSQLDYIRPILLDSYEQIKRERFSLIL